MQAFALFLPSTVHEIGSLSLWWCKFKAFLLGFPFGILRFPLEDNFLTIQYSNKVPSCFM